MKRLLMVLVALVAFGGFVSSVARAAVVKSLSELSLNSAQALRDSEMRLAADDRALQSLDRDRRHKRVSAEDYAWQSRDLVSYIGAEAQYQNELLTRNSSVDIVLPDGVSNVLRTVGKYTVYVGAYALRIAAGCLASAH